MKHKTDCSFFAKSLTFNAKAHPLVNGIITSNYFSKGPAKLAHFDTKIIEMGQVLAI